MVKPAKGLGRGLDALLSGDGKEDVTVSEIDVQSISPAPNQPRQRFDEAAIKELAESIKQHGILQPILVRPAQNGYQIIAGERRWRAACMAHLEIIPAIVKEMSDQQAAEISLVENLQREDLSAVEEARAFMRLISEHGYNQEQIAARVGKSRSHIANTIRILKLPDKILLMVEEGKISAGHARALIGMDQIRQMRLAKQIAGEGLSVREVERQADSKRKTRTKSATNHELIDIEEKLQRYLATRVKLKSKKQGGTIEIPYYSEDDLERIMEIIGVHLG